MELVYLWVEKYKNIENQGFNFSPRFECEFFPEYDENKKLKDNCKLVINEKKDYVSIFPDNINVTAIVGENGSGKSSVLEILYKIDLSKRGCKNYFVLAKKGDKYLNWGTYNKFETNITFSYDSLDIGMGSVKILNTETTEVHYSLHFFDGQMKEFQLYNTYSPINDIANFFIPKYVFTYKQYPFIEQFKKSYFFDTLLLNLEVLDFNDIKELIKNDEIKSNIEKMYNKINNKILETIFCYLIKKEYKNLETNDNLNWEQLITNLYSNDNIDIIDIVEFLQKSTIQDDGKGNIYLSLKIKEIKEKELNILSILQKFGETIDSSEVNSRNIPIFNLDLLNSENNSTYQSISTGEKQFLRLIIEVLGHYESKMIDRNIFLFDEVENNLHPSWQKKYFNEVIEVLQQLKLKNINLIFTTHSPFLLSDLPKENVIFLKKDENGNCKNVTKETNIETFGANIHTLFSHGFFMSDGLMGEFAKGKITKILNFLNGKNEFLDLTVTIKIPFVLQDSFFEKNLKPIIKMIGEDFLREKLLTMYDEKFKVKSKDDEIKELKAEIERLKNAQNKI
ncbi:ATP-binding protein [Arcobacter sp. FWKO B]|uniref:ATP-binding protein n=1 Tax=Arcobacter sp. FWKO B TaxID=2593672 RepID=UPI0018A5C7E7|nr:ATP-binding protein [Arcobacter sp. FWKO B]QOG11578.1 ATP-binding protein [Arcobacter sp. FWKO B]